MENEKIVIKVYKRMINDLTEQLIDLKVKLAYTSEMYSKLYEQSSLNFGSKVKRVDVMASQNIASETQLELDKLLSRQIDDSEFELTVRTTRCLNGEDIYYVGDLVKQTERLLLQTLNLGKKSLTEIKEFLSKYSLSLNMDVTGWVRPAFNRIYTMDNDLEIFRRREERKKKKKGRIC